MKKTKDQLLKEMGFLENENSNLQNDLDYFIEQSNNLYDELNKYKKQEQNVVIKDFDNFIWKLRCNELLDDKLENFIDEYFKYYNN